ncbi:MAG: ferritin-like domain-containing protein [Gemmatimonadales bacterium]
MPMQSLHELMLEELRDMLHAEKQLLKALPKMIDAASHAGLRSALHHHLGETEDQITNLKAAFKALGERATSKRCRAMEGIIKEADELLEEAGDIPDAVLDAAIIGMAQKVEHYEIASYGSILAYSQLMGHEAVTKLVQEILAQEENADKTLSGLAESEINSMAMA